MCVESKKYVITYTEDDKINCKVTVNSKSQAGAMIWFVTAYPHAICEKIEEVVSES